MLSYIRKRYGEPVRKLTGSFHKRSEPGTGKHAICKEACGPTLGAKRKESEPHGRQSNRHLRRSRRGVALLTVRGAVNRRETKSERHGDAVGRGASEGKRRVLLRRSRASQGRTAQLSEPASGYGDSAAERDGAAEADSLRGEAEQSGSERRERARRSCGTGSERHDWGGASGGGTQCPRRVRSIQAWCERTEEKRHRTRERR